MQKIQKNNQVNESKKDSNNNHFIPKAIVSEAIAIADMKNNKKKIDKNRSMNVTSDSFSGDNDTSSTQEDEEQDI